MDMQAAIRAVTERHNLSADAMRAVIRLIMTGAATPAQIGGFLIGLRMKGETVEEIAAAAEVMRELATRINVSGPHLVDTCGTGGDGAHTFNISTAAAFVVAAAGGKVAKHGNRSVSSKSGSADVLEVAGVSLELTPEQVAQCVNESSASVSVRAEISQRHEARHRSAPRNGRAHGVQSARSAHQPRRCAESGDWRFFRALGRATGRGIAKTRQRARARGARRGRHGRNLHRRADARGRAEGRTGARVYDSAGTVRVWRVATSKSSGVRVRRRAWRSSGTCSTTSRVRRAISWRSTPARRFTPPGLPDLDAGVKEGRRGHRQRRRPAPSSALWRR